MTHVFALTIDYFEMKNLLLFLLLIVHLNLAAQTIQPLWVNNQDENATTVGKLPFLLRDSFHNLIICGSVYSPGPAVGFKTSKFDNNGNKLWERRHQTAATDLITAATTDSEGAVYVGGVTINNPLGAPGNQIVIKYSAEGDTLWQYYLQVDQGVTSNISNLLLDETGNLVIFGAYFDTLQNRGGLFVQKKAPSGTLLWTATHVENDYSYGASDVRWIGDRWVFWGRNSTTDTRLLCWQIGPEGQTLGAVASEFYPGIIYNLHIDREGSLYLTQGNTYKVIKYDVSAGKKWEYFKPVLTFPQFIEAALLPALTTDIDLNIYATGYVRIDSFRIDALTIKLNSNGENLWSHYLSLPTSSLNLLADKLIWINDSLLLASGTVSDDGNSNLYECIFATYSTNGFVNGWGSDIEGQRNHINSIAIDGNYFYTTGITSSEVFPAPSKQFLCKYALQDIVSNIREEIATAGQISISPNPFSSQCSIVIDHKGGAQNGVLQLWNAQGIVVFRQNISLIYGLQSFNLEAFAHLPNGVYQVSILTEEGLYSVKAMKVD